MNPYISTSGICFFIEKLYILTLTSPRFLYVLSKQNEKIPPKNLHWFSYEGRGFEFPAIFGARETSLGQVFMLYCVNFNI